MAKKKKVIILVYFQPRNKITHPLNADSKQAYCVVPTVLP